MSLPFNQPALSTPAPLFHFIVLSLFRLHILAAVLRDEMKKTGVEEEEMAICLCGASQTDWQMDSPSDAQQR